MILRAAHAAMMADLVFEAAHLLGLRVVSCVDQQIWAIGKARLSFQMTRRVRTLG